MDELDLYLDEAKDLMTKSLNHLASELTKIRAGKANPAMLNGIIPDIEKAILTANIGLNPQNDGQQVIINIPMLTEERRKQLVKQVGHECEHGKVSVRAVRKETNEELKSIKGVSEDDVKNAEARVQEMTNDFITKIDALMKKKEGEIMT